MGAFAMINPGAGWPNKQWPAERFGALAAHLRDRHGLRSTVTWGPSERALAESVAHASNGAAAVAPATEIGDLLALARAASLCVAGDTGPAQLAAAVGTPVVGIFGPTNPARNGPWAADDTSVSRFHAVRVSPQAAVPARPAVHRHHRARRGHCRGRPAARVREAPWLT